MTEVKKTKKPASKKYMALKNLCTAKGLRIAKGEEVTLTAKEAEHFKQSKAI